MKRAIILHGMPSKEGYFNEKSQAQSNKHWLPWLQQQLIVRGILAQTPEMPEPYEPTYEKWKSVFEQFEINEDTSLVGHSCGAGFLVRWLSENKVKVGRVALVAPWVDPDHEMKNDFYNFTIDPELARRCEDIKIFYSDDDDKTILESVSQLEGAIAGIKTEVLHNLGHLIFADMQTEEFPELRDFLIK